MCSRNLVPRALFPGFGGGEKRPGDEVGVLADAFSKESAKIIDLG